MPKFSYLKWKEAFELFAKTFGSVDAQKALRQLQAEPLWSKLKVVEQDKVYVVGRYWVCCGPHAAHRVLDDLFRYLIE